MFRRKKIVVKTFVNGRGKWQWHMIASNGEKLAHSEEYETRQACDKTVEMIVKAKLEKKLSTSDSYLHAQG